MNLIFITLSMVGMRTYFARCLLPINDKANSSEVNFWLLVLSTVMIAAAGNIINDYFDVRSDRINRPSRVIVDKRLKKRWAIVLHWMLSVCAFFIALYLSWHYRTFAFVIIDSLSIAILWCYCISWKKKHVFGNISIGLLVSLVGLVMVEWATIDMLAEGTPIKNIRSMMLDIPMLYVPTICIELALIQTIAREILKDIENVRGDMANGSRTLPIALGLSNAKRMVGGLCLIFPMVYFIFLVVALSFYFPINWLRFLPLTLITLINLGVSIALFQKKYIVFVGDIKLFIEITLLLIIACFFVA